MLKQFVLLAAGVWAKAVDVSVEAPWRAAPESILALETIAQYNQSAYFPLLSVILDARERGSEKNEIELLYETAVSGQFLSTSQLALVKQEYQLGSQLPHFEENYQQFEALTDLGIQDCPVAMWTQGKASCDKTDLYALQADADAELPVLTESDKVIGSGDQWVILYADTDADEFPEWHAALLALALEQKITYVLRYRASADSPPTTLAGYGVGLHLKRTDYLVVDDRQLDGKELNLDLGAPEQIPASKVPFLSFRAAKEVRQLSGSDEEKLSLLQDLSFNFPRHAARLAESASQADEEAELKLNPGGGLGANGLFVNGLLVDKPDMFTLSSTLHKEDSLIEALESYLPPGADIPSLLYSGIALDEPSAENGTVAKLRYDLRETPDVVHWINDVEVDRPYEQMDTSLVTLAEATGPFAPIRRNIHSVVVAGDLEDRRTLAVLANLFQLVGRQLPLQIGLVSPSQLWNRVAKLGIDARQAFLVTLMRTQDFEEATEMARMAYEESGSPPQVRVGNPKKWMKRFSVESDKGPVIFVNGFPLAVEDWQETAMHIFAADAVQMRNMARAYLNDNDRSSTDLDIDLERDSLRDILFSSGAAERNTLVDPVGPVEYVPWPLSPLQLFTNLEVEAKAVVKHSVLFSSSFKHSENFELLDHILALASEDGSVEVAVRPLQGVHEQLYATLMDKSFNMFRFSRDLIGAARAHLFEKKTAPKVFAAASAPSLPADKLPDEPDSLIIDGRLVTLTPDISNDVMDQLLKREAPRVQRLQEQVPGLSGAGIAALSSSAQGRIQILSSDVPDVSVKSSRPQSSVLSFVIDPANQDAQELLGLAKLAQAADLSVDVYLTPARITNVPSRLYRSVSSRFEHARFESDSVKDDVLYTVEIVEPPNWLTVASDCAYDLDNVVLNMVRESEMRAVYTLRSLLIEGYTLGPDAPGTRLSLLNMSGEKQENTVIMANLGYFQLQAKRPGIYYVCTTNDDRAFFGYDTTSDCIPVPINSFIGAKLRPGIVPGPPAVQTAKTLAAHASSSSTTSSLWGKVGGMLKSRSSDANEKKQADVNIFTVASGHLYERFASIMMLSTMKHSKHSVKFWLIENFMSPKFKEFIPQFAAEHGFQYEFVSYKWPAWLRSQIEKQREIWGYKMLFLDVLFPQELTNVIFVDSDQIVRTDFKELVDLDLQGAPYAFTPMGDDREEMEPYRFWKQGYWKRTLLDNDLKYHISALYRVDLARFRELRVGDIMRQTYQRLSADPESLSNLDQDLPNSLQPHVPIYSLPQEWLWCETWCGDERLARAKTIDLCNNPLTKEPKLDRARRQIAEWTQYDEAVAAFQRQLDDSVLNESNRDETTAPKPVVSKHDTEDLASDPENDHVFSDMVDDNHYEL